MPTSPPDLSTSIFAILPSPGELQAIGEYYIRFAQMDAWLDVIIGKLLDIDWPSAQSVTVNLNIRAKIDMINSLLALRVQRLGQSEVRSYLMSCMTRVGGINNERNFMMHGRYVLPTKPEPGAYFVKLRADHRHIHQQDEAVDASEIRKRASDIKLLTDDLMHMIEREFPRFNAHEYMNAPGTP